MGVVRLVEYVAVVHYEMSLADQVHPDIVVPVSHGGIAGRGLGIPGAVEVLAVFPEFGEEVVPGRSGVADKVAWAEVVLAEILVDVGDAGLGVLPELAVGSA